MYDADSAVQEGKALLEKAITHAASGGPDATDLQVAEYKLQLGCVCWDLEAGLQVCMNLN